MDASAAAMPLPPPGVLETASRHLTGGLMFQLAAFVMVIYDHLITFSDEVERVWKRPFSGATALYLLNRYGTPLEITVVLVAFHAKWEDTYEGAGTIALVGICEIIMILRVYALYRGNKIILTCLLVIVFAQLSVQGYVLSTGVRVPLPPVHGFQGCILTGHTKFFGAFWVAPLVTDTCVFVLTLYKTRQYFATQVDMPTLEVLLRDGIVYFAVIFTANLLNVIIYFVATADLKAVCATFSQLITSVMISRLVLNLRGIGDRAAEGTRGPRVNRSLLFMRSTQRSKEDDTYARSWVATHLVGNLGAELAVSNNFTNSTTHSEPMTENPRTDEIPMRALGYGG